MTSSSIISPCGGSGTLDKLSVLQERSANGLNQVRDKGPPKADFMASQHGVFSHLGASCFNRSIP